MQKRTYKDSKRRFFDCPKTPLEGQELIDFVCRGRDFIDADVGYLLMTGMTQETIQHNQRVNHALDEWKMPKL